MPEIDNLVLEMALDSHGQIKVKADYDVAFSAEEKASKVKFEENAILYDRRGLLDDWFIGVGADEEASPGDLLQMLRNITDTQPDNIIMFLGGAADIDPNAVGSDGHRSYSKILDNTHRARLLESGREHPYVLVFLTPMHIGTAFALEGLEIDVGDPDEG